MGSVLSALDALSAAVDGAAARHAIHVANIANAAVPGYQRVPTEFNVMVSAESLQSEAASRVSDDSMGQSNVQVRVDQEMAMMAENAVRYQMLLGAFDYTLGLVRSAAREGR